MLLQRNENQQVTKGLSRLLLRTGKWDSLVGAVVGFRLEYQRLLRVYLTIQPKTKNQQPTTLSSILPTTDNQQPTTNNRQPITP